MGDGGDREVTGKSFMALWAVGRALWDVGAKKGIPGLIGLITAMKPLVSLLSSQPGPGATIGALGHCMGVWHCSPR